MTFSYSHTVCVCVCVCVCVFPRARARVCACSVIQLCLTLCDPMDCNHQAPLSMELSKQEILDQAAISYSRGSSQPRDRTCISCVSSIGRHVL